jgi:hypothetical protein
MAVTQRSFIDRPAVAVEVEAGNLEAAAERDVDALTALIVTVLPSQSPGKPGHRRRVAVGVPRWCGWECPSGSASA